MTTKERLHKLVDELSEQEADDALRYVASRRRGEGEEADSFARSRRATGTGIPDSVETGLTAPSARGLPAGPAGPWG